ncbi:MAG: HAD family hydrolase [Planctomycetales bacterium]
MISLPPLVASSLRYVALDFVGTVMAPTPSVGEVYHAIGAKHGSRLSVAEVTHRFREAFAATEQQPAPETSAGQDPWWTDEEAEFARWKKIVGLVLTDLPNPDVCFQELYDHFGKPESWQFFPDVPEGLQRLQRGGLKIVLASNFDRRLHSVCAGYPELQGLIPRIISSEVGARKPSARFFESLLKKVDCSPSEVLMVGDDLENDVRTPRTLGLPAFYLDRKGSDAGIKSFSSLTAICTALGL